MSGHYQNIDAFLCTRIVHPAIENPWRIITDAAWRVAYFNRFPRKLLEEPCVTFKALVICAALHGHMTACKRQLHNNYKHSAINHSSNMNKEVRYASTESARAAQSKSKSPRPKKLYRSSGATKPPSLRSTDERIRPMTTTRTLIADACVITLDPSLGNFPRADILIEDGRIVQIGPDLGVVDNAERIDASQMIAIPGFVDAHRHASQSVLRGVISDMPFLEYLTTIFPSYAPRFRPEDVYAGVLASGLMALDAGITTMVEFAHALETPEHADATVAALRESGIRAVYSHGTPVAEMFDRQSVQDPSEARRVRSTHFSSDNDLVRFGMALRGPELVGPDVNRADFQLARELDSRVTLHIIGAGGIEQMRDFLGDDTCYVHCSHSTDHELRLIRDSGGGVNVPAECDMSFHAAPITKKLISLGMKPSLGIDGGGVNSPDMFTASRFALQEARMREYEEYRLQSSEMKPTLSTVSRDALEWGTIQGARHFGLDDLTGTLSLGKQADIVLVRHDSLHMSPANDPLSTLVETAGPRDVDTVMVAGRIKKRDGKLVGADVQRVRRMLYEARDRLFSEVGVPRTCELLLPYRAATTASA